MRISSRQNAVDETISYWDKMKNKDFSKYWRKLKKNKKKRTVKADLIPGGLADGLPDSDFDPKELEMGIEDEGGEHTNSKKKAREIAKDHLAKNPKYYTDIAKKESSFRISSRHIVANSKGEYKYSCLMIDYPEAMVKKVKAWGKDNISDDVVFTDPEDPSLGREDHVHTTVNYGLEPDLTLDDIKEEVELGDLKVSLGKIGKFPSDDKKHYDVIKIDVESEDLQRLHKQIEDKIGAPGNTYPEYKPHVTIAYVEPGSCDDLIGESPFEGQEFIINDYDYSQANAPQVKKTAASKVPNPIRDSLDYGTNWVERVKRRMKKRKAALETLFKTA